MAYKIKVPKIVLIHHNPNYDNEMLDKLQHTINKFRDDNEKKGVCYPIC